MYISVYPQRALKVTTRILKWTLKLTRSQCIWIRKWPDSTHRCILNNLHTFWGGFVETSEQAIAIFQKGWDKSICHNFWFTAWESQREISCDRDHPKLKHETVRGTNKDFSFFSILIWKKCQPPMQDLNLNLTFRKSAAQENNKNRGWLCLHT